MYPQRNEQTASYGKLATGFQSKIAAMAPAALYGIGPLDSDWMALRPASKKPAPSEVQGKPECRKESQLRRAEPPQQIAKESLTRVVVA